MHDWRLIALDMDGTLLDQNGNVSEENKIWIQKAKKEGIEVTIATGRPVHFVQSFFDSLSLNVPFVTANGSEVWSSNRQLLERHTLASEQVYWLHQLSYKYELKFWCSVADHVIKPGVFPENPDAYKWLKFGYSIPDQLLWNEIWKELQDYGGLEVSSSGVHNIEINPMGVSKASGLQVVCNYLGIDSTEVVAMGDGLNDIKMLEWAGLGIAMGNALDIVKRKADRITETHTNHGVAIAIKHLLEGCPHKIFDMYE